ncbi:MAG: hypothetical protein VX565_01060, partial [Pseudomonadota bacterium]|nr:hypothetical protein [Pseudomonadota bacterium]
QFKLRKRFDVIFWEFRRGIEPFLLFAVNVFLSLLRTLEYLGQWPDGRIPDLQSTSRIYFERGGSG